MYEMFCAECKKEMRLRHMKNGDLAKSTGYKCSTIDAFFSDSKGRDKSEAVAKSISVALDVPLT